MNLEQMVRMIDQLNAEFHLIKKKQALLREDLHFLHRAPAWRVFFGIPDFIFAHWVLERKIRKYKKRHAIVTHFFHKLQQNAQAHFEGQYNQAFDDDGYPI